MEGKGDARAASAYVFLLFLSLYVLTFKGISTGDELLHYDLVQNVVASGRAYLPEGKYDPETRAGMMFFVARGTDGHVYLGLPNGLALASLPLGALGRIVDSWLGIGKVIDPLAQQDEEGMRKAMEALRRYPSALFTAAVNPLATALTVGLFFALVARVVCSLRDALRTTLLLGLATIIWPYSTNYWTQPIAGLFLFASLYVTHCTERALGWRRALSAGLLAGAAFLCRFDTLPLSAWLLLYCLMRAPGAAAKRWVVGISFMAGLGGAVALQATWNAYRFGDWLQVGTALQSWRVFRGDIIGVLPLQLVSPYRGIFFYSPALVLGVAGLLAGC